MPPRRKRKTAKPKEPPDETKEPEPGVVTQKKRRKTINNTENETTAPKKPKLKEPPIDWAQSAAKQFLKRSFRDGTIPLNYMTKDGGPGPKHVWDNHCKDNPAFKHMLYSSLFQSRLAGVKNDHFAKDKRADLDQKAFDNFRKLHPRPMVDHNGIELWDGSEAQRLLKEDMANGKHKEGDPSDLWASKKEYQVYELQVFRDHIYQEQRLWKLQNFLVLEGKKKQKVIKDPKPGAAKSSDDPATGDANTTKQLT